MGPGGGGDQDLEKELSAQEGPTGDTVSQQDEDPQSLFLGSPRTRGPHAGDPAGKEQFLLDQGWREQSDQNSLSLFPDASE